MHTMEVISLKTKPRRSWSVLLYNRATEQRTQDGASSLDGGQPQTKSALWVMGYRRGLLLWWDIKTGQTIRMTPVGLHSLSCRQAYRGVRPNQAIGVSISAENVKLITPVKATGSVKREMEIVSTPGQIFHLHQTWHA